MSARTPGRLTVRGGYSIYADDGKTPVADTCLTNSVPTNDEANARRLVACWNACDGLPTDLLEDDSIMKIEGRIRRERDELLEALIAAQQFIDELRQDMHHERVADWYPEGAHNSAAAMSESMRLIGNRCADFDAIEKAIAKATGGEA